MPLLEVTDLRTYFTTDTGVARAVDGVSLQVGPGETLGIVGESGCGKTVTALSVLGLIPSPPGEIVSGSSIRFNDEELLDVEPARLRQIRGNEISMIFQEPMTSLNPVLTIGHQIKEVLMLHRGLSKREARAARVALLAEVGIPEPDQRFDCYPHQMSGGMLQRVMIAIALSCEPRLLIADEPTTALDVTIQAQILDLLVSLQQKHGMALLLITHDLGVIAEVCDRVMVMYGGQIVEMGTTAEILTDPQHPYTQGLLASLPGIGDRDIRLNPIPGTVPSAVDWPEGCRFRERCSFAWERCAESAPSLLRVEGGSGQAASCWRVESGDSPSGPSRRAGVTPPEVAGPSVGENGAGENGAVDALLDVQDLKKYFPVRRGVLGRSQEHVRAVDGVSFRLQRGETLGLVGESGCGKSTTGRAILHLIEPTSGRLIYDGQDLADLDRAQSRAFRRPAQIVFQDPFGSLNPRMTVGGMLAEILKVHGLGETGMDRSARARELLDIVGLHAEHAGRYPHEFSGGQRQRIGIARALAVEPEFIVCDEPVSALDVSVQAQVINLLRDLQRDRGLTYLFIAHDLAVVEYMSDRVAVMYLGKIVEMAAAQDLYKSPRHPYTRALLSAAPRRDPQAGPTRERIRLSGDVPSPIRPPSGCPFYTRCPHPGKDEECQRAVPPLDEKAPGHLAACIKNPMPAGRA